jgi:molecular chaperone DnaK (HSP70)
MSLVGLDLNSSRIRAVSGPAGSVPRGLVLEGGRGELPLALSLERRHVEVGWAGVQLCRRLPHLACVNFLPHLGEPAHVRRHWVAGRHRFEAESATALVLKRLAGPLNGTQGLLSAVPAYLSRSQAAALARLMEQARLPLVSSVSAPLAGALAGYLDDPWAGPALVADVDEHAFTWSVIVADERHLQILGEQSFARLSLRAWKGRLLDAIADRCIRHSRRDPRDSGPAEQMLYEQLDRALDAARRGETVELVIRAEHWFQNLLLRAEELGAFCTPLVQQAVAAMRTVLSAAQTGAAGVVLATDSASRLPGLLEAIHQAAGMEVWVTALSVEAVARGAHQLASAVQAGKLSRGHHDVAIPFHAVGGPRPVARKPRPACRP